MKELSLSKKIENGKLVRIRARINEGIIEYIQITGDFFLHPEQLIERIEKKLVGKKIPEVEQTISKILDSNDGLMIGCSSKDIQQILGEGLL